jgi:hypothetical protein
MDSAEEIIKSLFERYDDINLLTGTLYRVWRGNKKGVFSTEKQVLVVPVKYDGIDRLTDTFYRVWKGDEKQGLLNIQNGEIIWK